MYRALRYDARLPTRLSVRSRLLHEECPGNSRQCERRTGCSATSEHDIWVANELRVVSGRRVSSRNFVSVIVRENFWKEGGWSKERQGG